MGLRGKKNLISFRMKKKINELPRTSSIFTLKINTKRIPKNKKMKETEHTAHTHTHTHTHTYAQHNHTQPLQITDTPTKPPPHVSDSSIFSLFSRSAFFWMALHSPTTPPPAAAASAGLTPNWLMTSSSCPVRSAALNEDSAWRRKRDKIRCCE